MKKILIISSGFPANGGQASTAYNLNVLLSENNYEVKIIFLKNSEEYGDIDPNSTTNSQKINYAIALKFPYLRKILKFLISLRVFKILGITSFLNKIYKLLQNILVKRKIYSFLKKNNFKPDLAITNTPILYENFYSLFERTLIIIGSSIFFWKIGKRHIDYQTFKKNAEFLNYKSYKNKILGLNKSHLIYNSQLTHDFFHMYGVRPKSKKVQYFNIPPFIASPHNSFENRKYDIGIIISNFHRQVKGVKKVDKLFNFFASQNKIAIGKNSKILKNHSNSHIFNLMGQKQLSEYLSDIKLVIIPSLIDPSPSILSEAILNGCNVLCSKNIGWNDYINKDCVINDYNNDDEWVNKIKHLLKKKIENEKFLKLVSNSKEKIHETINDFIAQ